MRSQFTLQTLLLSAVVIWSSMAAFGPGGLAIAAILLAAVAYIRSSESMWRPAGVVGLIILCGSCLLGLLLPMASAAREAARQATCINQLKWIAIALHNYHDIYGCFPPAVTPDQNGKPMHSWRVLMMPYMEKEVPKYDFSEPWDGPNNRKLAGASVSCYVCPNRNRTTASPITNYVAVVGSKTLWRDDKTVKIDEIPDGAANTIMLVEIVNSDIHWMQPRDLSFEEALRGINPKSAPGISSQHIHNNGYFFHGTPVVNVAFADGTVRTLPEGFSPKTLEALLTADGGETVDRDDLESMLRQLNWANCLALLTLVVSVILLLVRPRDKTSGVPTA